MRLVVFGASIVSGCWDPEGGWVSYLRQDLYPDAQLYNLGISGDTSADLLDRIENELSARVLEEMETVSVISIGGNDSLYFEDEERTWVSREDYRENLEEILQVAENLSDRVIFVESPPFDDSRVKPLEWDSTRSYDNDRTREYMEIAREICSSRGILFVRVMDELGEDFRESLVDGVHPGTGGHRKIYRVVREGLEDEGVI